MSMIQIILIASIVFVVVAITMYMVMNRGASQKDKQLEIIKGKHAIEGRHDEKDLQGRRRAEIARKLKNEKVDVEKGKKKFSIAMKLEQAGLSLRPVHFWVFSLITCLVSVLLAKYMSFSLVMTVLIGVIGFFGIPRFVLKKLIARRQKHFLQEFADALDAMVRLLKAGMPVSEAILMISREFEGPVGEEMSRVYDKQKIGIPLYEAALEATNRMPITEMQMFATGLAIQAQTGSSLSEVLTNLSGVIRARFRLKRKIMALSSEAIASASIIGALPPLVGLGLWAVSPGYLDPLFYTDFGNTLLTGAAIWMGIGILVMKQMINFKI